MKRKNAGTKALETVGFSSAIYDSADWQQTAQALLERRWERLQPATEGRQAKLKRANVMRSRRHATSEPQPLSVTQNSVQGPYGSTTRTLWRLKYAPCLRWATQYSKE